MPILSGITIQGGTLGIYVPPTVPTTIGEAFGGGYYAGQISTAGNGVATHYLIVAPKSSGESTKQWNTTNTDSPGTSSVIDGPTNSSNMNDANHPAAQFCKGLTIGGYTDWYMPALNELEVLYYNLKPTTNSNNTSSGINTNAVPSRSSNYTSGTPAQTSVTDFKNSGTQAFTYNPGLGLYPTQFSSTQGFSPAYGTLIDFQTGQSTVSFKSNYRPVRAIRRIPV